ncbi:hypothetical protein [Palleronia sp.]|uniref:hypothetical protein n=1 Tax=Palleronia sp. TaxID=1940284 RepID=UPI0035C84E3F
MLRVLIFLFATTPAVSDPLPRVEKTPVAPFLTAQASTCARKTCGQMLSCAEACHALTVCGDRARGAEDNDGIPFASLCSARC